MFGDMTAPSPRSFRPTKGAWTIIGLETLSAPHGVRRLRQADQRFDVSRIKCQGALKETARFAKFSGDVTFVRRKPSPENKDPSNRAFSARSARRASAASKLRPKRVREARDDLVLHIEEIGDRLIEALGPEVVAGLGVDKLHVDAHPIAAALHATLQNIAHIQVAADLLNIDRFAFEREGRIARDYRRPPMRERSVVRLSVTPSTKYSCSGSPPIFAKGSTTIDRRGGCVWPPGDC